MKKYFLFYLLSLLLFPSLAIAETATVTATHQQALHFAPLPMENREIVYKQFEPLRVYLERITGQKVFFRYFDNYSSLLEDFINGGIDIAYLGPLPYVELRDNYPKVEPLVTFLNTSGKNGYTCSLVSLPENQINLSNITDKNIALTQPLSTCGYLSVNELLKKHGSSLEANNYSYLERHDEVALAVIRAEFDIGGVKTAIARQYEHLGLQIVEETEILPGFTLVSNKNTIDARLAARIRNAFTALKPNGKDKEMLSNWGQQIANGAALATDEQYDIIRTLRGNYRYPR